MARSGGAAALALLALALLLLLRAPSPSPVSFDDDLGIPPPGVGWRHRIGDAPEDGADAKRPRPTPMRGAVDDGARHGAPLGGLGSGSIGRSYLGDFSRWHLKVGSHTHRVAAHTFAACRVNGVATVLSASPAHASLEGVPSSEDDDDSPPPRTRRRRTLPEDGSGGNYTALYPRAWYEYAPDALHPDARVVVSQVQFSPVLPGDYRASAVPTGVLRFVARNDGRATANVSIMLSFESVLASADVAPLDVSGPRDAWRVASEPTTHETFFSSRESRREGRRRRRIIVGGAHAHTVGVTDGTFTPSADHHGGVAIAAEGGDGVEVSVLREYDTLDGDAVAAAWDAFERNGGFAEDEDEEDEAAAEEDAASTASAPAAKVASPGAAAAVSAKFSLKPGERRSIAFAIAWDLPVATFPRGPAFLKRYAWRRRRRGGGAADVAMSALRRAASWERRVRAWQAPYVDSAANADSKSPVRRPGWFVTALFNELYYLVDGGTLWGRPLSVGGLDGDEFDDDEDDEVEDALDGDSADDAEVRLLPIRPRSRGERRSLRRLGLLGGEDGDGGDARDVIGNGGAWGGTLGRFGSASDVDRATYNALDEYFYGSWPLATLWPGLDLAVIGDLAHAVDAADDTERRVLWRALGSAKKSAGGTGATTTTIASQTKRRKIRGVAPRDLGTSRDAPLTSAPNALSDVDSNALLDLAPKLMLLVARAHALRGGFRGPEAMASFGGGLERDALRRVFEPAYRALATQLRARDLNGDGLPEHGDADAPTLSGYDRWVVSGNASSYGGGLWLAALRAGAGIARDLDETDARTSLEETLRIAAKSFDEALWRGGGGGGGGGVRKSQSRSRRGTHALEGYYAADASGTDAGDVVLAGQVMGEWALGMIRAPGVLDPRKVRAALSTTYERNVKAFGRARGGSGSGSDDEPSTYVPSGAVNGARVDDATDAAALGVGAGDGIPAQARESRVGQSYALASHLILAGFPDEGWDVARGAYRVTYEDGFAFRTPEIFDAERRFRGAISGRAGAVWAIERSLATAAARARRSEEARAAREKGDDATPAASRDARVEDKDEL